MWWVWLIVGIYVGFSCGVFVFGLIETYWDLQAAKRAYDEARERKEG